MARPFLNLYATQALLPELAAAFGVSQARVGLTITATTLAIALTAPFVGAFADVVGRKRIIVAAAFGLIAPTLAAAGASGIHGLLLWRFVQGLFMPAIFATTVAYIGEEWEPVEVGAVTGLYVAGTVFGGFCGRFVPGLVAEHASWREGFLALAALNALAATAVWAWLPPARRFARSARTGALTKLARHLRNRRLLATYAVGFGLLFSQVATFTYVGFRLSEPPFGLGPSALGSIFSVFLLGVVVTPIAARGIHRFGHRATLAAALALSALGLVGLTLGSSLRLVVLGLALGSSGVFIGQAAATSFIPVAASDARSSAVGLYLSFYYLGGSCGAVAPSLVWTAFGWTGCVVLIIVTQLLSASIGLVFWRSRIDAQKAIDPNGAGDRP